MSYIGRFAPTPTGALHQGSLVAAVGSYLRAKQANGKWLLRIEDLDPPREQAGAADSILRTLEAHGFEWDDSVIYQSQQHAIYQAACEQLIAQGNAYRCTCTRTVINASAKKGPFGAIYPQTCRRKYNNHGALRIITHDKSIQFYDARIGFYAQKLESELGDFVIQRADGLFAYQLAVVIDDAEEGITEIVRGEDLLDNTPRQIHLQKLLGCKTPAYCHLPLVYGESGQKLSKQNMAPMLNNLLAVRNLKLALGTLGVSAEEIETDNVGELLEWAVKNCKLETTNSIHSMKTQGDKQIADT